MHHQQGPLGRPILICTLVGEIYWVWTLLGFNGRHARTSLVILLPWEGISYKHKILHQDQLWSNGMASSRLRLNFNGGIYGTKCVARMKAHSFGQSSIKKSWWHHGEPKSLLTLMTNVKRAWQTYHKLSHIGFGIIEWPTKHGISPSELST